jgi:hypothetical protein
MALYPDFCLPGTACRTSLEILFSELYPVVSSTLTNQLAVCPIIVFLNIIHRPVFI